MEVYGLHFRIFSKTLVRARQVPSKNRLCPHLGHPSRHEPKSQITDQALARFRLELVSRGDATKGIAVCRLKAIAASDAVDKENCHGELWRTFIR